jgi:predicted nuclease of predicted toxin-antitoxin system
MPPASSVPSWRFLVDDNLPATLIQALGSHGWYVEHTQDVGLRGRPDTEVFTYAQAHSEAIITQDHDLADRRRFPPPHAGIVLVQLPQEWPRPQKEQRIVQALRGLSGSSLAGALVIIERSQVLVSR